MHRSVNDPKRQSPYDLQRKKDEGKEMTDKWEDGNYVFHPEINYEPSSTDELLKSRQSLEALLARIAELEAAKNSYRDRCVELESRLDLYYGNMYDVVVDENERLIARIVDLRTLIDRLINVGNKVVHARPMWIAEGDDWDALVKYWSEREK